MEGKLESKLEVNVPAREIWDIYGGLKLGQLGSKLVPDHFERVEVIEGDGGVGTVLRVIFPPGTPNLTSHIEKFTVVDSEKRIKVAEVIKGGYLDLGFSLYRVRFEIIEKDANSSIIKTTIEYKVDNAARASLVSTASLDLVAEAIAKYLTEKKV
ncbi:hypothetical protein IFM89_017508 [Coptis chinensis]|uniref:Bet v I/Major latex protein domain-containing protein n=1 Tax=Coptis chinensis TaxID=261450 RepID=A0A835HUC1_9MAGN|nr:hypothetical protein IFM89_017508 [Coptis chinensis]